MFTAETIAHFAAMAGEDFTWSDARGGARPPSSYMGRKGFRAIVRADIAARQGEVCPVCGDTLDETGEFNHGVSRGPAVKGFHAGNVFIGHAACNTRCERVYGPVIPFSAYARPDVIPTEWTPFPVLVRS